MGKELKESLTVSPFFLFFLIHGTQTGVGLLGFQTKIFRGAEQDAWVSILLVGAAFHIIGVLMYFLLKHARNGDIMSLHKELFGRWMGNILNLLLYSYCILIVSIVIRSYLEVLMTWVFPSTPLWILSFILLIVIVNIVKGGFRVITGICFWGVILPSFLFFSVYYLIKYAHWSNLLPLFNHGIHDYFVSAKDSMLSFLGPEFLLIYYPYIKNNLHSQKWFHFGMGYTTLLYFLVAIFTFVYFSHGQLLHTVWPTLIMSKIIRFPFIERFEYVYIFTWVLVFLPTCCIAVWGGVRILKESIGMKPDITLWVSVILIQMIVTLCKDTIDVNKVESITNLFSSIFLFTYLPVLSLWVFIRNKLKRTNKEITNLNPS